MSCSFTVLKQTHMKVFLTHSLWLKNNPTPLTSLKLCLQNAIHCSQKDLKIIRSNKVTENRPEEVVTLLPTINTPLSLGLCAVVKFTESTIRPIVFEAQQKT